MIEKDIVHLRFLQQRVEKGDTLTQEDFNFVMNFENQIQLYQNIICTILTTEKCKNENC